MNNYSLFDILSNDERIILCSDPSERTIITWNKSLTLQCYVQTPNGKFDEIDARTLSCEPKSIEQAIKEAIKWRNS